MTAEEFEKECRVKHYRDLAGQAQEDRRMGERRSRVLPPPTTTGPRRLGADRRSAYQAPAPSGPSTSAPHCPTCDCGAS